MEKQKILANKLKSAYLFCFFLILSLPILSLAPWLSPPDWGKTILFRIALSLIIFLFLYQSLFQKTNNRFATIIKDILKKKTNASWGFWLLISLFGIFFLSTIFSQDVSYSLFGDPHRAGGFLNFGFYIIFAVLSFFTLTRKDWRQMWKWSILIGIFVAIIAIFQKYSIMSDFFVPVAGRPFSTIGNSVLLATYLLLLFFMVLSFFLKEKHRIKKFIYLLPLLLFAFVILLTESRAGYFGLFIGIYYFILFFPTRYTNQENLDKPKINKKIIALKIFFIALLVLGVFGVYYINSEQPIPQYVEKNQLYKIIESRSSFNLIKADPRFSVWEISGEAIKEKPILGYGLENFSIGFDKYYDPSLKNISRDWGSWWDRAHSFVFDIGVTGGIPALIIYLSLFAALFIALQKSKKKNPEKLIFLHGAQAAFLGYLANNLFSFDTFSSYLIFFLLIGYSLHLIYDIDVNPEENPLEVKLPEIIMKLKKPIIFFAFIILILFIWTYNLKPLYVNKEINLALVEASQGDCENAFTRMDKFFTPKELKEKEQKEPSQGFLDQYLGMKYAEITGTCMKDINSALITIPLAEGVVEKLEQAVKERPNYTRYWVTLGIYTNFLIEKKKASYSEEEIKILKDNADYYFKKATDLSPKRQEVIVEWAKTDLVTENYLAMKDKAQQCIDLYEATGECWWLRGVANLYLDDKETAKKDFELAQANRYDLNVESFLLQLSALYQKTDNYKEEAEVYRQLILGVEPNNHEYYQIVFTYYMAEKDYEPLIAVHERLIAVNPTNDRYYAALAYNYKMIGNYDKAQRTALEIIKINPEKESEVKEFINSLPL